MKYIKEVVKKNRIMVISYVAIGIFNTFMTSYKADYFQKVIDGLTDSCIRQVYSNKELSNWRFHPIYITSKGFA